MSSGDGTKDDGQAVPKRFNLQLPAKKRHSRLSTSSEASSSTSVKRHNYDEVTLNFGKPVVASAAPPGSVPETPGGNDDDDIFRAVSFKSPIEDLPGNSRPNLVPNYSQVYQRPGQESGYSEPVDEFLNGNDDVFGKVTVVGGYSEPLDGRASNESKDAARDCDESSAENIYADIDDGNDTKEVFSRWFDEACKEIMDSEFFDREESKKPEAQGVRSTLLRTFDPLLSVEADEDESSSDEDYYEEPPPPVPASDPPSTKQRCAYENVWFGCPDADEDGICISKVPSSSSSSSTPVPSTSVPSTPPATPSVVSEPEKPEIVVSLPMGQPPRNLKALSKVSETEENIYECFELESPSSTPPVPSPEPQGKPALPNHPPPSDKTNDEGKFFTKTRFSSVRKLSSGFPRSSSELDIKKTFSSLKKRSFKLKPAAESPQRTLSEVNIQTSTDPLFNGEKWSDITAMKVKILKDRLPRLSILQAQEPPTRNLEEEIVPDRTSSVMHSGPIWMAHKRKLFQSKWCVLGNGSLSIFDRNPQQRLPTEQIPLKYFSCVTKRYQKEKQGFYCIYAEFSAKKLLSKSCYKSGYHGRTLGFQDLDTCNQWFEKIVQSLSPYLMAYSTPYPGDCMLLGVHMKTGFASEWHQQAWVEILPSSRHGGKRVLRHRILDQEWVEHDLKKVKNLTLIKDARSLRSEYAFPALLIDFIDSSLYLMPTRLKDFDVIKQTVESVAFNNGNDMNEQQVNQDGIPVIVDMCLKFVYGYGSKSEGIYRKSGVNKIIDQLLEDFRKNAWEVTLNRELYSEHDVANTVKRFLRTLSEPLLPKSLHDDFTDAAGIEFETDKISRYRELLQQLPEVNYKTLKMIVTHLRAVSASSNNLMTHTNLAALWGPTLMVVDDPNDVATLSGFLDSNLESEVCTDLLDHCNEIFEIGLEELERERMLASTLDRLQVEDNISNHGRNSGDMRLWVHIDSKASGRSVCLAVHPNMTAHEMAKAAVTSVPEGRDVEQYMLYEVVLQGQLERPIHHQENILDVTLKWGSWSEQDRMDNYLLLKKTNPFYQAALPLATPHVTAFMEAKFSLGSPHISGFKTSGFKKFKFAMSKASIVCSKDVAGVEMASWPIEDVWWYFGCERSRRPPHRLNVTFFDRQESMERTKAKPLFGNVISIEKKNDFVKWVAAMLFSEHYTDLKPPPLTTPDISSLKL